MSSAGQGSKFWGKLVVMTEKRVFDSNFHRWYVGGEGEVSMGREPFRPKNEAKGMSYDDVLAAYRAYVRDPEADLPEEILAELRKFGKI